MILETLETSLTTYLVLIGCLGLMVGSFLNVVIYRLPLTLKETELQINIVYPGSFCPHCNTPISFQDNIPILGYLKLLGKCRFCKTAISVRYPLVELLTAVSSVYVAYHFGFSLKTVGALLLTWALIALSFIDYDEIILPDAITLPFLWLGLFLSLFPIFANSTECILGAILGYLSLWSIYWIYKIFTDKEGLGFGDFKLLAMLGAWLGWQAVPFIILIASSLGAMIGLCLIFRGRDKNHPMPFGPFLSLGGWITLLWQSDFLRWYFNLFTVSL